MIEDQGWVEGATRDARDERRIVEVEIGVGRVMYRVWWTAFSASMLANAIWICAPKLVSLAAKALHYG